MEEKILKTRLINKHDTEENWKKAVNFIPKAGETIEYDPDEQHPYTRTKKGDGDTLINDLPFVGITRSAGLDAVEEGLNTQATAQASHAEGFGSQAIDSYAHAEGWETISNGRGAHTEGYKSQAEGNYGHAEGYNTRAGIKGQDTATAHAEGYTTQALGHSSHAEGRSTQSLGYASHAEGRDTIAEKNHSHAEGKSTQAKGENAHTEGTYVAAFGAQSHAEGRGGTGVDIITDGVVTNIGFGSGVAISAESHIEGRDTIAGQMGYYIDSIDFTDINAPIITLSKNRETPTTPFKLCLFEGEVASDMIAKNEYQVGDVISIINSNTYANCATITAVNNNKLTVSALPFDSFVKNPNNYSAYTVNYTLCVHTKPRIGIVDIAQDSHAEGRTTHALQFSAHAEGESTWAMGKAAHAEGHNTKAYASSTHAEGWNSEAIGANSHAGGMGAKSIGNGSFAHGSDSNAHATGSIVLGVGLEATGDNQTVVGSYNLAVADAVFIVGCGTSNTNRKNAMVVKRDGTIEYSK